jgi:hypothetical protein
MPASTVGDMRFAACDQGRSASQLVGLTITFRESLTVKYAVSCNRDTAIGGLPWPRQYDVRSVAALSCDVQYDAPGNGYFLGFTFPIAAGVAISVF